MSDELTKVRLYHIDRLKVLGLKFLTIFKG